MKFDQRINIHWIILNNAVAFQFLYVIKKRYFHTILHDVLLYVLEHFAFVNGWVQRVIKVSLLIFNLNHLTKLEIYQTFIRKHNSKTV